ncbi:hypothetical protein BDP55DRAFT_562079 [Colletotrichum godetiae]|uniref:Chromo domain-containing protein n=1 Tax=Colletotrichum godetiae TaxID=1209918 RepID=A0AAJ0AB25_9PEZI|nr:uncharacterized protein BDP55DRAFT_562079 [Colletotrichum godetiae]KAK1659871.1 hypothetical protein BDP55DRAFT_562079 [Colletotrichum godetiae]
MHRLPGLHQRPAPPPKHLSTRSRKSIGLLRQAVRNRWKILISLQERAELVRIPNVAATNETKTAEYSSSPSFGNHSSGDTFHFKHADTPMRHAAASADHQRIDVVQLIGHRVSRRDRSRIELCVLRPNHAKSWRPEREVQINAPDEWLAYTSSVEHRACLGEHQRDKWHILAIHSHWIVLAMKGKRKYRKVMFRVSWEGSLERTSITERSARLRSSAMVAEYWRHWGGRDTALLDADIREA